VAAPTAGCPLPAATGGLEAAPLGLDALPPFDAGAAALPVQSGGHALEDAHGFLWRKGAASPDQVAQRLAIHVLHDDHHVTVGLSAHVVDGDHVSVAERSSDERLAFQARQAAWIARGVYALESDAPPKLGCPRPT
jgi:hypothetical protein